MSFNELDTEWKEKEKKRLHPIAAIVFAVAVNNCSLLLYHASLWTMKRYMSGFIVPIFAPFVCVMASSEERNNWLLEYEFWDLHY